MKRILIVVSVVAAAVCSTSVSAGAVPAGTRPTPPTDVSAVGVDGVIDVSWDPPADSRGTILGYQVVVTHARSTQTCTTTGATSCYVTHLVNARRIP